ncbi:RidA family protein [Kribbella turkmenica]|uniref:RidA family protein n=1 Tax=Kribbella turkmenica TaxID=2530375 RepID=A0A4R4XD57_9ACTN|nr:RidA family protein [Kribbella turkmenica]TDD28372.1 RidA family protein [Kribbella turkmenica]
MSGIDWPVARLSADLGYPIPDYVPSPNRFLAARKAGNLVFVSSVTPRRSDGSEVSGKILVDVSVDAAKDAAKWCVANSLAALASVVDPTTVVGVVDMLVACNTAQEFGDHSEIADAASLHLEALFGAAGRHTRGAIGCASLVRNVCVVAKIVYEAM